MRCDARAGKRGCSVVIASLLESICHVGQDMLRPVACQSGKADGKQKDYGNDDGVLGNTLALFARATIMDFSRQGVSPH